MSWSPTYGTDVEIFLVREDGTLASPQDVLPRPKVVEKIGPAGGWNRDGIAIEINPEPSKSYELVSQRIETLRSMIEPVLRHMGMSLMRAVRVNIREQMPVERLQDLPNDCWELGCDPDYNAYSGKKNDVEVDPYEYPYRTAGGHITMGTPLRRFEDACELVKLFDVYAGLFSVAFMEGPDATERRRLYGKAGCFRFYKDTGLVEYRTPSSDWFWWSEGDGYRALCSQMNRALIAYQSGLRLSDKEAARRVIHVINNGLKAEAEEMVP